MNEAAFDRLLDKVRPLLPAEYKLIVYGSSALSLAESRDIDLMAMVPSGGEATCHTILHESIGLPCNLYMVPEPVFLGDVQRLEFGGYYAHKMALSFREVGGSGSVRDPARLFWKSERARLERETGHRQDTDGLIRQVHMEILLQRPTFLRPLSKFVRSKNRVDALRKWLQRIDAEQDSDDLCQLASPSEYSSFREKAMWRYWREYNLRKGTAGIWSDETISKMQSSLDLDFVNAVRTYWGNVNYDTKAE
jgi:hypothetical protein